MGRSLEHLDAFVSAVVQADHVHDALFRFAMAMEDAGMAPVLVAMASFESEHTVKVIAAWSAVPTFFEAGTTVDVTLTHDTHALAVAIRRGRVLAFRNDERDQGIVTDLLGGEGIQSLLAVPLHAAESVVAFLGVGSKLRDAFGGDARILFEGFGRGVEDHLVDLAKGMSPA